MNNLYKEIQFLLCVIEILGVFILLSIFLKKRKCIKGRKFVICFLVFLLALVENFNRYIVYYSTTLTLFLIISIFIISLIFYKQNILMSLIIITNYFYVLSLFDMLVISCIHSSVTYNIGLYIETTLDYPRILLMAVTRGLICSFVYIIYRKISIHHIENIRIGKYIKFFIPVVILETAGLNGFEYIYIDSIDLTAQWIEFILLFILFVLLFYIYVIYRNEKEKLLSTQILLESLEVNYNSVISLYKERENIYHDFKNHIIVISSLIEHEDYDEVKKYISNLKSPISEIGGIVLSSNNLVDIIFNYKYFEAKEKNIKIVFDVDMLENYNFSMSENELCAVFSNVLDNAIEACANIVGFDPIIQVSLKKANDMLFFRVQNPCIQCQKNASGKFISTKDDKLLHGIGLRSVTSVIEKYDGHIVYDIEGNSFVIDIMM